MSQTQYSPKKSKPTTFKRIISSAVRLFLTGLVLLLAALYYTHGLREGNLLQSGGGFLGITIAGWFMMAQVFPLLRLRAAVWALAAGGLVIASLTTVSIALATQVPVSSICNGLSVAAAAPYAGGPGPHPVEVVHNGRRIWYPPVAGWQPASTEETELVACVGGIEQYEIQTCSYVGGPDIIRYGYRREVTLLAAESGELIATAAFEGAPPRQCSQTEERSVRTLRGEKQIDTDELWTWLSAWIYPAAAAPDPDLPTPSPPPLFPQAGVLTGSPVLWSGPDKQGEPMNIFLHEGEPVEILATTEEWTQVRWVSPTDEAVIGWVQSRWIGSP